MAEPCVYIQPSNSLLMEKLRGEIIDKICQKINSFPNHEKHKNDLELLLMACLVCEHLITNKKNDKYRLNKKDIVIEAFMKCFQSTNNADKELWGKNIEFLHDNDKIKKVKLHNIIFSTMSDWFRRKIA